MGCDDISIFVDDPKGRPGAVEHVGCFTVAALEAALKKSSKSTVDEYAAVIYLEQPSHNQGSPRYYITMKLLDDIVSAPMDHKAVVHLAVHRTSIKTNGKKEITMENVMYEMKSIDTKDVNPRIRTDSSNRHWERERERMGLLKQERMGLLQQHQQRELEQQYQGKQQYQQRQLEQQEREQQYQQIELEQYQEQRHQANLQRLRAEEAQRLKDQRIKYY
jgi:hypothetical protein